MALTSTQEQYLKGLGIGKGAGRGGAIGGAGKGAAKGAAIGSVVPGLGTGIGAALGGLLGGIGGLFGGKARAKKQQAEARARLEQANAVFNRGEDTRQARVGAGSDLLAGLSGKGFTALSPEVLASLKTRRELDPAEAGLYNPSAGAGSEAFSGVIDQGFDYATEAASGMGGRSPIDTGISAGQPIGGLDTGALQLEDLYKLQGSGTRDFG